jgi:hypothetical protein
MPRVADIATGIASQDAMVSSLRTNLTQLPSANQLAIFVLMKHLKKYRFSECSGET